LQENECLRNAMLSKHHCEVLQDRLEQLNEARIKKQKAKLKLISHSTKLRKLLNWFSWPTKSGLFHYAANESVWYIDWT